MSHGRRAPPRFGANLGDDVGVFWQVGSSATLGTATAFLGNILALASVTLNTTGLSGMIESRNTSACEMKTDRCQRVPDGALCDGWRKRPLEAESALRFGVTENRARDEAEVQRLTRIVLESTCGKS